MRRHRCVGAGEHNPLESLFDGCCATCLEAWPCTTERELHAAELQAVGPGEEIDVVFDGPPSHESGRFVEVEDMQGRGVKAGEWVERDNGFWALRVRVATGSVFR